MNVRLCIVSFSLLLAFATTGPASAEHRDILSIYGDSLDTRFVDRSTVTHNLSCRSAAHTGFNSISVQFSNYSDLTLRSSAISLLPYYLLSFWVYGGQYGGQQFTIQAVRGLRTVLPPVPVGSFIRGGVIPANQWVQVVIPLAALQVSAAGDFSGLSFVSTSANPQSTVYLDDIMLVSPPLAD